MKVKFTFKKALVFKDNNDYDYILLSMTKAIQLFKSRTTTGQVLHIDELLNIVDMDNDSVLDLVGYMYNQGMLKHLSKNNYMCYYPEEYHYYDYDY